MISARNFLLSAVATFYPGLVRGQLVAPDQHRAPRQYQPARKSDVAGIDALSVFAIFVDSFAEVASPLDGLDRARSTHILNLPLIVRAEHQHPDLPEVDAPPIAE